MRVITLDEFGNEQFVQVLTNLRDTSGDRNSRWFPVLLENYRKYRQWYFLMDGDTLAAFATIQEYYNRCYRMLTRTYIYPDYRRPTLPKNDNFLSPSMRLVQRQLIDVSDYQTLFVSIENIRRRSALKHFSNKMIQATSLNWNVHPHMLKTCDADDIDCWQNVCYTGAMPRLNSISINEWNRRYGKQ